MLLYFFWYYNVSNKDVKVFVITWSLILSLHFHKYYTLAAWHENRVFLSLIIFKSSSPYYYKIVYLVNILSLWILKSRIATEWLQKIYKNYSFLQTENKRKIIHKTAEKYTRIILFDRQETKRKIIHKTRQKFSKC